GDADETLDARCKSGMALDLVDEIGRLLGSSVADDQRQHRMAAAVEGSDHAAVALDDGELRAVLPDREGVALLDADFERIGIDLADRSGLHPGQPDDALASGLGVEADE